MDANKIIDDLGGTSVVADMCKVTSGAVSQWRHDGIPPARLMYLRAVRPDVFEAAGGDPAVASKEAA